MKTLAIFFSLFCCISAFAESKSYRADDAAIESMFSQAQDVSYAFQPAATFSTVSTKAEGGQTKGNFLIRAFFCGAFALHRSYMGSKGLFIKYFCTLGVIGCVDFWWTIIKGDEAFNKFKGNDKWIVWNDK